LKKHKESEEKDKKSDFRKRKKYAERQSLLLKEDDLIGEVKEKMKEKNKTFQRLFSRFDHK